MKRRVLAGASLLSVPALFFGMHFATAAEPIPNSDPAFRGVWSRTDFTVANHTVNRTWFWGPAPNSPGLIEEVHDLQGGTRLVQYFDKSRMELNNPAGNPNDPFYVTNGLLTVELISGRMQVGTNEYVTRYPACIPTTGDPNDTNAPTYWAMQKVSNTTLGDHPADDRTGQGVTETIDHDGNVSNNPPMNVITGTVNAYFDTVTKHNIPKVFWDFLNQTGPVYVNDTITNTQVISPWNYASGRPISEAYWTKATIAGQLTPVMIQMYERRALTYVPTNPDGWQVEMANIGQHYYDWRYRGAGNCNTGTPVATVEPTLAVTGTPGTAVATGTAAATGTAVATGTAEPTGSPAPSETVTPGGTVTATTTAEATTTPMATTTAEATMTAEATATPSPTPPEEP
jgi:hypothetical protein